MVFETTETHLPRVGLEIDLPMHNTRFFIIPNRKALIQDQFFGTRPNFGLRPGQQDNRPFQNDGFSDAGCFWLLLLLFVVVVVFVCCFCLLFLFVVFVCCCCFCLLFLFVVVVFVVV